MIIKNNKIFKINNLTNQKNLESGFTLIELMLVVSIISVLAAFALPAYQDYAIKARVAEGLTLSKALRTSITEAYNSQGPRSMACNSNKPNWCASINATAPQPTRNIASISSTEAGKVTIAYDESVSQGAKIDFIPVSNIASDGTYTVLQLNQAAKGGTPFHYICRASNTDGMPEKYLPTVCKP